MRDPEPLARRLQKRVLQILRRGKRNGVHQHIQLPVLLFDLRKDLIDLRVVRHIALERLRPRQFLDQPQRLGLHALVLIADRQLRPGLMQLGGNAPGDAALIRQSKNCRDAAFQIEHASVRSAKSSSGAIQSQPALQL